ncbi:hypothetical protein [Mycobacterium palustre]|uniref:Uncharacterized protein n=1 Tax=Mycobacterium palustre TaxID=153971 RepID=A0A1X1ZVX8_9MYCO|nr:hypothetical protein [Mycobacterium palustre]MCV7101539.1 hypothetical protein [Mycobacterium palustre]ORW28182.1 hypothetical protein AWC19_27490 [Mycobacterium palustre]
MSTKAPTTKQALQEAQEVTATAADALAAANAAVPTAQQALAAAEAKVQELLVQASLGAPGVDMTSIGKARAQAEQAKSDVEWAALKSQAAQAAYQRAEELEHAANRACVRDEYLAEIKRWNSADERESVLLRQLEDVVAEFVPLMAARKSLHARLGAAVDHFPPDELAELRSAEAEAVPEPLRGPRLGSTQRQVKLIHLPVPLEIGEALERGLAAGGWK